MTREELFEAIGEVSEDLVEETRAARERAERASSDAGAEARARGKRRRRSRAPIAVGVILAACAAAAIAIPAVSGMIRGNGSADGGAAAVTGMDEGTITTGGTASEEALDAGTPQAAANEEEAAAPEAAAERAASSEQAVSYDAAADEALEAVPVLEFNGCLYEAADDPEVLARFGLPAQITEDMAGEHIAWLLPEEGFGYEPSAAETDAELLQYAPAPCRGACVLRDGDRYMAAIFCGFIPLTDPNASVELSELFRVYGIEGAEDIALICETDRDRSGQIGEAVTDRRDVAFLYEELTVRDSWGNDDFQAAVFGGTPEEDAAEAHAAFADDMRMLRFETADGLRFYLEYYPSYGWLYGQGTLSWYRAEGRLAAWLNEYLGV